jgi:hypothetical protein
LDEEEPEAVEDERRAFTPDQDWEAARGGDFDPVNDVFTLED